MVIKVYISGISGNKEVCKLQKIAHDIVDNYLIHLLFSAGEKTPAKSIVNIRFEKCKIRSDRYRRAGCRRGQGFRAE